MRKFRRRRSVSGFDTDGCTRRKRSRATRPVTTSNVQIEDAKLAIDGLNKNKELITIRRDFYATREFVNAGETAALALSGVSLGVHVAGTVADVLGGVLSLIPDFQLGASGFGGSPHASAKTGGLSFSKTSELAARALYQTATILDKTASMTTTLAGYQRRMEDWTLQRNLASKELEQMEKQIAAAQKKLEIAEKDLENHDLQTRTRGRWPTSSATSTPTRNSTNG